MNFGKLKVCFLMEVKIGIFFDDVVGVDEVKEEL